MTEYTLTTGTCGMFRQNDSELVAQPAGGDTFDAVPHDARGRHKAMLEMISKEN